MAVDLHTHSNFSDGSDSPTRIIDLAVAADLTTVALTDHDGVDGVDEAAQAAEGRIGFIPGVELSVRWEDRAAHLLVYWLTPDSPLSDLLGEIRDDRASRNREMVAALVSLGIEITEDEIATESGRGVTGRPHIAAVLVAKGAVGSIPEAFDQYLAEGRPAYRGRLRLDLTRATALAKESGSVAVIAHPHTIADNEDSFRHLFETMRDVGVDGVECHYAEYAPEMRQRLAGYARSLGLVPTGGSDYHGTYKQGIDLAFGRGDLVVPDTVVVELEERRARA